MQVFAANQAAAAAAPSSQNQVSGAQTAVEKFKDFMEKTPEEIMFESFLKRNDLTPEEFEKLSPEKKEALMTEFEEELRARAEL